MDPFERFSGLSRWLSSKESACSAGDTGDEGSIPGLEKSPGGGNGNPLQYSCLENAMDRGAWPVTVQRVAKSQTPLSTIIMFNYKPDLVRQEAAVAGETAPALQVGA